MIFSNANIYFSRGTELIIANMITGNVDIYCDEAHGKMLHALQSNNPQQLGAYIEYLSARGFVYENEEEENIEIRKVKEQLNESKDELSIVIMPTEQCNFRCIYCCEPHSVHVLNKENQERLVTFIKAVLPRFKKLHIEWFGGEPLLEIDIIEDMSKRIMDMCRMYGVAYYASCSTNGYDLSLENFTRMIKSGVLFFQITIDGMEQTHNAQRPLADMSGTWKRIVNNLIDIKNKANSQLFSIVLRTNVTVDIEKNLANYIEYMQSIFYNDRRFYFYIRKAEDWGMISDENLGKLCANTEYIRILSSVNLRNIRTDMHRRMLLPSERLCRTTVKNSFVVFADGRVTKCSRDIAGIDNELGTLEDICRNPKSALNRSMFRVENQSCRNCKNYYLCLGLTCSFERQQCQYYRERLISTLEVLLRTDASINRVYNID